MAQIKLTRRALHLFRNSRFLELFLNHSGVVKSSCFLDTSVTLSPVRHVGYNFSRPGYSSGLTISSQAANELVQNGAQVVDIVHLVVMVFAVVIYRLYDPFYYSRKL